MRLTNGAQIDATGIASPDVRPYESIKVMIIIRVRLAGLRDEIIGRARFRSHAAVRKPIFDEPRLLLDVEIRELWPHAGGVFSIDSFRVVAAAAFLGIAGLHDVRPTDMRVPSLPDVG